MNNYFFLCFNSHHGCIYLENKNHWFSTLIIRTPIITDNNWPPNQKIYIYIYKKNERQKNDSLADSTWWHPQVCKRAMQTDASTESSQPHSACTVAGWFFGQAYQGSWPQVGEGLQLVEAPGQGMWLPTYWSVAWKKLLEWRLYVS